MQYDGDEALEMLGRMKRKAPKTKFGKALRKIGRGFATASAAVATGGASLLVQRRVKKLRSMLAKMTPQQRAEYKAKHGARLRKLIGAAALGPVFAAFPVTGGIIAAVKMRKRIAARRKLIRPAAVALPTVTAPAMAAAAAMVPSPSYSPAGMAPPASLPTTVGPQDDVEPSMPEVQPPDEQTDFENPTEEEQQESAEEVIEEELEA